MWHWYKQWRRKRLLQQSRLTDFMWQRAISNMPLLHGLTAEELQRLRNFVVIFLHGKEISGAGDLLVTDHMRLLIAVQACLPILNLDPDWYDGWVSIVVYPASFIPDREVHDSSGLIHRQRFEHAGEAWQGGPVVLSWESTEYGGELDGFNVVIHEFAHKLDMLSGAVNGQPPLHADMQPAEWRRVFIAAYLDFCQRVERHEDGWLDPYAAENPGEFFAVLSEHFFEVPDMLVADYPEVYQQLSRFYRQDPLARLAKLLPVVKTALRY